MSHPTFVTSNHNASLAADSLTIMMEQETTTYAVHDYLCDHKGSINRTEDRCNNKKVLKITPSDRMKIVDWCYDIVDQCHFDRDTVAVAMSITDRFVSIPASHAFLYDCSHYQLVAITALYISIKLNEREALGRDGMAVVSQGMYSAKDIEDMEMTILQRLQWRVCSPTSLQVGYKILELLLSPEVVKTMEKGTLMFLEEEFSYQVECSVRDYHFAVQWSSTIALAAILNAIELSCGKGCEYMVKKLSPILRRFDFDSPVTLMATKRRLCKI